MFKFLKIQFELGKIDEADLEKLVGKKITQEQFELIVGGDTDAELDSQSTDTETK